MSKRISSQNLLMKQLQRSGCQVLIILKLIEFNLHLSHQFHNCCRFPNAITFQALFVRTIWVAGIIVTVKEAQQFLIKTTSASPYRGLSMYSYPAVSRACLWLALGYSLNFKVIEQKLPLYAKTEWTLVAAEIPPSLLQIPIVKLIFTNTVRNTAPYYHVCY